MKKLILSFALILTMVLGAAAQNHQTKSVLRVAALNTGTNGWGVTNLSCLFTNNGMVYNPTNVSYTNAAGTFVGSDTTYLGYINTTNSFTTASLFNDIPLNPDAMGRPVQYAFWEMNLGNVTNITFFGNQDLFIDYVNPRGSNAPIGVVFRPIYDDEGPGGIGSVPYANGYTGDDWGVRIAGLTTTRGNIRTNIPTWRWPGAKYLRVVAVTNEYILAGPAAQTNSTFITRMSVSGFRP